MEISKLAPQGISSNAPETPPSKDKLSAAIDAAVGRDLEEVESAAAVEDQADIRPLDVPGGLQILLAETRAAFQQIAEFLGSASPPTFGSAPEIAPANPVQAARQIVEWVLQSLPEHSSDVTVWASAMLKTESALQAGLELSVNTVSNWREVPPGVIDAVTQAGALVLQALSDELPNPLWLRPEWVGLAPRLQRFQRRRRAARRGLTDPDYWQGSLNDDEQHR